ncbi:MAG: CARDB domain-containing protein, partial [Bacteroidales bacterium]
IWLSRSDEFNEDDAILSIKPFDFDTLNLEIGNSISRQRMLSIPDSVFGEFYIHVRADNASKFCEVPYEDNNLSGYGPFTIALSAQKDLQVTNIQAPGDVEAGSQLNLKYHIENKGEGEVNGIEVKDSIVLFNEQDTIYLSSFIMQRNIPGNNKLSENLLITVPHKTPPGNYNIIVYTDTENRVYEHNAENNNTGILQNLSITRNPDRLAELEVSDVSITNQIAGESMSVSYRVSNISNKETEINYWTDKLILVNAENEISLEKLSTGNQSLAKNQSYTRNIDIELPVDFIGEYNFRLIADTDDQVMEYDIDNNIHEEIIEIELNDWADLEISEFNYPSELTAGQEATFSWEITNAGTRVTEKDFWTDKIYLSKNNAITRNDKELVKVARELILLEGDAYTGEATVRIPSEVSGTFYLILSTDALDNIFENQSEENNLAFSSGPILVNRPSPADIKPEITNVDFGGKRVNYT